MSNATLTTTQYASYEETAIVATYTYTATVVTEQGESTATLTARADLDCPRRREIACPNCRCWHQLHWNINLQAYEPVHCNSCCIGLYDIAMQQPAVVAEPVVVTEVAAPQVATVEQELDAMIAQIDSELASVATEMWDDEFDAPYVAPNEELSEETLALCAADTTVYNLDEPLALDALPGWMQPENATQAEPGPVEEPAPLKPVNPDKKQYFVVWATSQSDEKKKYALLCQKATGLAVNCSCPSRTYRKGRACKHMRAHNAMLQPVTRKQEAA